MTGLHASNHNLRCNNGLAQKFNRDFEDDSLAPWVQATGAHTIHVGKYLNGYGGSSASRYTPTGWDDWRVLDGDSAYKYTRFDIVNNGTLEQYGRNGDNSYSTDVLTSHLDDAIRQVPSDDPFFAVFTPLAPHYEGGNDNRFAIPAPRHENTIFDVLRPDNYDACFKRGDKCPISGSDLRRGGISPGVQAVIDNGYQTASESLLAVDEAFTAITDTLAELGRLQNTVIIFTSDNGFSYGEHGIQLGKKVPTRESLFVPLFIAGPGFNTASQVTAPVSNIDLAPTIADIFDATPTQVFDGQSLLDPISEDRALFIEAKQQLEHRLLWGVCR